jgi:hypothetical protein
MIILKGLQLNYDYRNLPSVLEELILTNSFLVLAANVKNKRK